MAPGVPSLMPPPCRLSLPVPRPQAGTPAVGTSLYYSWFLFRHLSFPLGCWKCTWSNHDSKYLMSICWVGSAPSPGTKTNSASPQGTYSRWSFISSRIQHIHSFIHSLLHQASTNGPCTGWDGLPCSYHLLFAQGGESDGPAQPWGRKDSACQCVIINKIKSFQRTWDVLRGCCRLKIGTENSESRSNL